jgi:hypothetical protein
MRHQAWGFLTSLPLVLGPLSPARTGDHAVEAMLRLLVMANGPTMPGSNETQTSTAWRVLVSVATSSLLIFVAHAGTIISSGAQNSSSNVILIKDSLSTTFGSSDRKTFMLYALSALTPVPRSANVAVNGETLATMVSDFSAHVGILYDPKYRLIVHILAGTIDIRAASSAARIYSLLQTYVNNVHEAPRFWGQSCSMRHLQSRERAGSFGSAGWNVAQGSGGLGADGLVRLLGEYNDRAGKLQRFDILQLPQ